MNSSTVTQASASVSLPVVNSTPTPISSSSPSLNSQTSGSGPGIKGTNERSPIDGNQILSKQRLQELVREVDPNEQLDDDVEDLLLLIADDFIENVATTSCLLAKHRKSNTLEVKDVQLSLEKNWNMWIPGFGSDELRPYKKSATTEAHKQRLALIRKTLKKF